MKRIALFLAALAVSAGAFAAEESEIKHSGEFRVRYFNDLNRTGQENGKQQADTEARFKLNVSFRKGEKVQGYLSLIHDSQFGAAGNTENNLSNVDNQTAYSNSGHPNDLIVSRAWGLWKATDSLVLKVGRFGMEIADGAVLAENDWDAYPTTHEGLIALIDTSFANFAVAAVKTNEYGALGTGPQNSDPERNVYGVSADIKNMPEMIKIANVHFIQVNKDETNGAGSQNLQHIGFTAGGDVSNILFKVTAAFQTGVVSKTAAAEQKLSSNMIDLMGGYSMPELMGLKATVSFHMDSGDDNTTDKTTKTYQPLFYDRHNYAGLMDVVEWGNLTYIALGATMTPSETYEVGGGLYFFSKTQEKDGINEGPRHPNFTEAKGTAIGNELDLFANKAYEGGIKMGARFGVFMPGAVLSDATPKQDKTMMQVMLQASMAF